jgi:hypothetical protein
MSLSHRAQYHDSHYSTSVNSKERITSRDVGDFEIYALRESGAARD